jgi:AbrB family looped-hinge helix DNA binding protein
MAIRLRISPEGRISLPAAMRARLGIERGGTLIVDEVEYGVLLRSVAQAIEQAQMINLKHLAGNTDASVDAFLAARIGDSGE